MALTECYRETETQAGIAYDETLPRPAIRREIRESPGDMVLQLVMVIIGATLQYHNGQAGNRLRWEGA